MSQSAKGRLLEALRTDGDSREEAVERVAADAGWPSVAEAFLAVLGDDNLDFEDWTAAANTLWGVVLDQREVDADRAIALLYWRFDPQGDAENNLVWSITSKLKNVGYLSRYEPLQDPGVVRELARIKSGG
jgi:hypothetical protein